MGHEEKHDRVNDKLFSHSVYGTSNTGRPFTMSVVGKRGTGKTFFLLDLLEREYKDHFNHIDIICGTFDYNATWQDWKYKNDPDVVVLPYDDENVDHLIRQVTEASKERGSFRNGNCNLLILDDAASTKDVKKQNGALVKCGFESRHQGLSVIVLTQQFKSVAKAWRENTDYFVIFNNTSLKDVTQVFDDLLGRVSKEEREEILKLLESKDYARLEIDVSRNRAIHKVVLPD